MKFSFLIVMLFSFNLWSLPFTIQNKDDLNSKKYQLPSIDQMRDYFKKELQQGKIIKRRVLKHKITGTKREIETLKELILNKKILYQNNIVKKKNKISKKLFTECKDVYCMCKKIFGETESNYILYAWVKYRWNLSQFANIKGQKINIDDLKVLIQTMQILPENLLAGEFIKRKKYMTVLKDEKHDCDKFYENIAKTGYSQIQLYPRWSCKKTAAKIATIIHEAGHVLSNFMHRGYPEFAMTDGWHKANSWIRTKENYYAFEKEAQGKCHVSRYAFFHPGEDFAETFTAYIFAPEYFKQTCPEKYQLHKKLFYLPVDQLKNWLKGEKEL